MKQELFIKEQAKEKCCRDGCCETKLDYHAYCRTHYNEYMKTYNFHKNHELECKILYRIMYVHKSIIVYTGKTDLPTQRYKSHFESRTGTGFARMVHSSEGDINNYTMEVLDLSSLNLTEKEHLALEHQYNYSNRETVVNTDITVTEGDMMVLEQLYDRAGKEIDELKWETYEEFIIRKEQQKNKLSVCESSDNLPLKNTI